MKRYIYLDHNATTRPRPEVVEAMLPHLRGHYGNASSIYQLGQEERKAIDMAREQLAKLIGVQNPDEIVFTGGGSESINWALKGVAFACRDKGKHIVTTTIEHSAVMKTCKYLESLGWQITYVGVDWHGRVNPAHIREAITPQTVLVSVMHANNEIGTIEPIEEITRLSHEKGVPVHVDAVQTTGKIPVSVEAIGCDLLSIGAHKFYGPKGVGALYIRPGTRIHPLIHGGSHERNRRAGTENVAGIAGLGVAAALALKDMKHDEKHVRHLRDKLEKAILHEVECVRLNGPPSHFLKEEDHAPKNAGSQGSLEQRMFNTSNLSIEAVEGEGLIIGLDMQGICVSSGSACSSGQTEPSHVLRAIGLPIELAKGSIRFSLGRDNTNEEIEKVIEVFPKVIERLRGLSPLWSDYKKGLRKSVISGKAA